MPETIPDTAAPLFDDTNFAVVTTLLPDGSPQATPVWVDRDDGVPLFNTAKGRAKHRNLERDPRMALCLVNRDNPYEYVQVRGRAEIVEDGATDHIHELAGKYRGEPRYPLSEGEERVIVRVIADSVQHYGA